MKGFYYFMMWTVMCLFIYFVGYPILAILIVLFAILDSIIQGTCGIWKRIDKIMEIMTGESK